MICLQPSNFLGLSYSFIDWSRHTWRWNNIVKRSGMQIIRNEEKRLLLKTIDLARKQLNWFFHGKNAVCDNRENNDD